MEEIMKTDIPTTEPNNFGWTAEIVYTHRVHCIYCTTSSHHVEQSQVISNHYLCNVELRHRTAHFVRQKIVASHSLTGRIIIASNENLPEYERKWIQTKGAEKIQWKIGMHDQTSIFYLFYHVYSFCFIFNLTRLDFMYNYFYLCILFYVWLSVPSNAVCISTNFVCVYTSVCLLFVRISLLLSFLHTFYC